MKKIFLLFLLLIPLSVRAEDDAKLSLTCPVGGTKNSTLTCAIKINTDVAIKEVSFDFDFNNNFSYLSFVSQSDFEILTSSPSSIDIKHEHGATGDFVIGNLSFKILKSGKLSLKNIKLIDSNDNIYKADLLEKSMKILSEDNTLKSLKVSSGTLKPVFNANTTSYTVEVDSDVLTIDTVANDANASVPSPYKAELKYGQNVINIVVTSESGSKRTYKITATRKDDRSGNNNIKTIKISNGNINFSEDKTVYSIVLDSGISEVNIEAELEDSKSSFVKDYGPRKVKLGDSKTVVELKVASENGSVKTYTLNFVKDVNELSSNNKISSLTIEGYNIDFNKDIYSYDIKVDGKKEIKFKVELDDPNASYEVKNADLKDGNTIVIKVIAENGDVQEYKFNIIKENKVSNSTSDFICNDNSILYYLLFFFLGAFISALILGLIHKKKNKKIAKIKKIEKSNNPQTKVSGNTEVLDFDKEDLL